MRYQHRKINRHVGEVIEEIFLVKSGGSGEGTRTPDPRIMIFGPRISGNFCLFP